MTAGWCNGANQESIGNGPGWLGPSGTNRNIIESPKQFGFTRFFAVWMPLADPTGRLSSACS
jgi:hypothetical protein